MHSFHIKYNTVFNIFLKHLEIKGIIHSKWFFLIKWTVSENIMPHYVLKFQNSSQYFGTESFQVIWLYLMEKKTLQFKLLFIDNLTLKLAVNHWDWTTESMNSRITKTDYVTWIKQFLKYKGTNSMDNYYDFVALMRFDIFSQRSLSLLNTFLKISPFVFHKVIWFWNDIRICRYWHIFIF